MFDNLYELGKQMLAEKKAPKGSVSMDSAAESEKPSSKALFQEQAVAVEAMGALNAWFETTDEDLGDGEGFGDRLYALMVSLADDDKNGEISDEEAEIINIGVNAVFDYLVAKGVAEENAEALLTEFDNDVADNVRELVLGNLPVGEDEMQDDMDEIIFADAENESIFDSAQAVDFMQDFAKDNRITLDAAYRAVFAIRNGKKKRIKKRISGVVRLTAKQKIAIRKAQRKSHTGMARMKRLKSFKLRKKLGV